MTEPSDNLMQQSGEDWPLRARVYQREDEWVFEIEGVLGDTHLTSRHTEPLTTAYADVPGLPSLYAPPHRGNEIERVAAILGAWDMKEPPNSFTGHDYRDIAADILSALSPSDDVAKVVAWFKAMPPDARAFTNSDIADAIERGDWRGDHLSHAEKGEGRSHRGGGGCAG